MKIKSSLLLVALTPMGVGGNQITVLAEGEKPYPASAALSGVGVSHATVLLICQMRPKVAEGLADPPSLLPQPPPLPTRRNS